MNEEKIKRMLSPERMARMDGETLIAQMNLVGTETVVDAGAGPGAFTFRFAEALPKGQVLAVDVSQPLLDSIEARAEAENIVNIRTVQAERLDIPQNSADKVFCCTVLHEVPEKTDFLSAYYRILKPGGKIYIAEFTSGRRSLEEADTIRRTFIASERTEAVLDECGFKAISTRLINPLIYLTIAEKS